MQSGKTCRWYKGKEVLDLFKHIPLEKLKATIQRVVQVYNKCLEARRSCASPACKIGDERYDTAWILKCVLF
ncbi:hypothetical protein MKW98_013754 [Papaver atlanticum]|uniref:Uncharacterized protein n=1 Tax=Papaver atlanticum TaxID=357466 RepID=A0AAD4S8I7_9MAGN|nr:hypothetical protein MKW98_013754 [Papaver atlanticum]